MFLNIKEIKIIKQSERQQVILSDDTNGKKYIKRVIRGDKREIYKTLQKINHPNIPQIYYVGFDSDTIIIEEYIDGISLNDFMEQKKKISKKQLYRVSNQMLSALETLHKFDIIHRDIKPDNILIDTSNHIWITDYDIARIYRKDIRRDTETIGTFGYAPIEQYGVLPTDCKTDIYAFGVTLTSLLDYLGIKGYLYKVAEKCKRLDPAERYKNINAIKKSLLINKIKPVFIIIILVAALISRTATGPYDNKKIDDSPEKAISLNDESKDLIRFVDFNLTETQIEYGHLENYNTTSIFSGEEMWQYLPLMEDTQNSGTILLGKNHNTPVKADVALTNGVFSVSLKDGFDHSFQKDFIFDGNYKFNILYPDNRRINAEMVCRDLDGDAVEELLIGICDCSMTVTETSIYQYFNYSIGWVLRYDEVRGFILCDGDMFSENSKLVFVENDLRVHLPYAAANTHDKAGYELKGNTIIPFI